MSDYDIPIVKLRIMLNIIPDDTLSFDPGALAGILSYLPKLEVLCLDQENVVSDSEDHDVGRPQGSLPQVDFTWGDTWVSEHIQFRIEFLNLNVWVIGCLLFGIECFSIPANPHILLWGDC